MSRQESDVIELTIEVTNDLDQYDDGLELKVTRVTCEGKNPIGNIAWLDFELTDTISLEDFEEFKKYKTGAILKVEVQCWCETIDSVIYGTEYNGGVKVLSVRETAKSVCKRLGFKELTEEQKKNNLEDNLQSFLYW